ncbi:MAG: sugar phosphate nucleotidyltransferase [bacterium]|nr:sugar phosphate nucleotidyltransferase [bacterium]
MKGIILAGGMGTRLRPLTLITNKHLLPVYNKPMILYPIETLRQSGISEIMLVCGREHAGDFINFLGSGKEYGVKLAYAVQDKNNGGIADALAYAEDFSDGDSVAVILGDNIFEDSFRGSVKSFKAGARVFLKKVKDPQRYGVPVFDKKDKKIIKIEEKPENPKSHYALTGFYLVDNDIFSFIKKLKPSKRGELEMTDALNHYVEMGKTSFSIVNGQWYDTGTIDSLLESALQIKKKISEKN